MLQPRAGVQIATGRNRVQRERPDRNNRKMSHGSERGSPIAVIRFQRTQKIDFGMCMLTSMCGTSTVSEIFRSPASELST